MIENVKFRKLNCSFQQKLSSDIKNNIQKSDELLVPADKTSNFYKMDKPSYNDLLHKNITNTYKNVTPTTTNRIELEAKNIYEKLDQDDRINTTAKREAFITLKDHKPNFVNNPTCRLINPAKSDIGRISKQILDRINTNITTKLNLNQWKNTKSVLNWFNNIKNKDQFSFIAFDVVDFYPSISSDLLNAALDFASSYDNITDDERHIILHARKSLLYNSGEPWGKKTSSNLFDVTMGSYDGAETCELVGAFLLQNIQEKHGKNFGLYRDYGLGISNASPREVELIKKDLCTIFRNHGLKITIEANKKTVNFLDVIYQTVNTCPILSPTTHHFTSTENLITRLASSTTSPSLLIIDSEISCNEDSFNKATPQYQKALNDSRYAHNLQYSQPAPAQSVTSPTKKRHRNTIWYNPPLQQERTDEHRTDLSKHP